MVSIVGHKNLQYKGSYACIAGLQETRRPDFGRHWILALRKISGLRFFHNLHMIGRNKRKVHIYFDCKMDCFMLTSNEEANNKVLTLYPWIYCNMVTKQITFLHNFIYSIYCISTPHK